MMTGPGRLRVWLGPLTAATLALATFAMGPAASAAPRNDRGAGSPELSVSATADASAASIEYTLNRNPDSVVGLDCTLSGPTTSSDCGTIEASTRTSVTYALTFTGLDAGSYRYAVTATLDDGGQAAGSATFEITKLTPTCQVSGYDVVYDGKPHTATGSCTGVDGTTLSGTLDLTATSHTDAGTYTDTWQFTPASPDYTATSGTVTDSIDPAAPACTVTGYNVDYDGTAHTATGSCTGVDGTTLSGTLELGGTSHTDAGTYTDPWIFYPDSPDYTIVAGVVISTIAPVSPDCTVTGYSVTYDGNPHTATGTCTGVDGAVLSGLDLSGTTHTDVGTYSDTWTFTDSTGNYWNLSGTVSDVISQASSSGGGGGGVGGCAVPVSQHGAGRTGPFLVTC